MTSDELIARLVAIADERPNVSIGHVVEHELPELRAQAEAMNNGAATNAGRAHVNLGTSGSATEDAAPPSAAQPVAWIQSNHLDNIRRDHRFYCSLADHKFQSNYRPLYTAPPDLAERVKELESLLRELHPYLDSLICYASTRTEYKPNDIVARIDAALAEGGEMSGHGHVTPNADGSKARCGGPGFCRECSIEAGKHWFTQQARIAALESELARVTKGRDAYERRLRAAITVLCEARDAIQCITRAQAKLHSIDLTLGERMDNVGIKERWLAIDAARKEGTK